MRTHEEIIQYIDQHMSEDMFGAIIGDLIEYLPYEHAKKYLKEHVTREQYETDGVPRELTRDGVLTKIREYIPFAAKKANDERGLSASRSIQHFMTWLWLINDMELYNFAKDDANYPMYGKPVIRKIAEKYGINITVTIEPLDYPPVTFNIKITDYISYMNAMAHYMATNFNPEEKAVVHGVDSPDTRRMTSDVMNQAYTHAFDISEEMKKLEKRVAAIIR